MALLGDIRSYPRRASSPASITSYLPPHSHIEILLSLPDVRIVEFKPLGLDSKSINTKEYALREVEPGTLPWSTRFERTVAVGLLRIYRAPESIAFLNCQNAIRPILPKSQAWCVDGESKFVIGSPPLFWRIEVPKISHDEEKRVEEIKRVLDQILKYEKTPCPFRRRVKDELTSSPTKLFKEESQTPTNHSKESKDLNNGSSNGFQSYIFDTRFPKSNKPIPNLSPRFKIHQDSLELSEKYSSSAFNSKYSETPTTINQYTDNKFESHSSIEKTHGSNVGKFISQRSTHLQVEQKFQKRRCHSASYNAIHSLTLDPSHSFDSTSTVEHGKSTPGNFLEDVPHSDGSNSNLLSHHTSSNLSSTWTEISPKSSIPNHSDPHFKSFLTTYRDSEKSVSESVVAKKSQEKNNLSYSGFGSDDKELALDVRSTKPSVEVEKFEETILKVPRSVLPDDSLRPQNRRDTDSDNFSRSNSLTPALSYKMLNLAHQVPTKIVRKTSDILITPSNNLIQLMLGIASSIVSGEWRGVLSNFGEPTHWDFEDDSDDDWLDSDYRNSSRVKMSDIKISGSWEFD
ncbi:hypothetical protein EPUL_005968 [Erysiphe pulchra]|uniref:Inheritance of peroxisomes protein 1 n=1 Tax=Erysiphe pulchra TaxID=225359 RepID=A0A2S4PM65_9PEZI|nr:hypothetical protein EPUL_005968 [Erysiphe pulchra]